MIDPFELAVEARLRQAFAREALRRATEQLDLSAVADAAFQSGYAQALIDLANRLTAAGLPGGAPAEDRDGDL